MMLADVHAHLTDRHVEDVPSIIERARAAGVKAIITNGLGPSDNKKQLELSKEYDIVKVALGFYPTEAEKVNEEKLNEEIEFIKSNSDNIVAIGEIGLDKKDAPDEEAWNKQVNVFRKMLELAIELRKPVLIHSRKAEREVIDILSEYNLPCVVMHCFGGKKALIRECIEKKYYFSIPPIIKTSTHFQGIVELVPLSRLLTETDTPYLSPFKDKLNEPAFVEGTITEFARIKGTTSEDTEKAVFKNYLDCFTG